MPLGASGEGFGSQFNFVALTIPPKADLAEIKRILQQGDADGSRYRVRAGAVSVSERGQSVNARKTSRAFVPHGVLVRLSAGIHRGGRVAGGWPLGVSRVP